MFRYYITLSIAKSLLPAEVLLHREGFFVVALLRMTGAGCYDTVSNAGIHVGSTGCPCIAMRDRLLKFGMAESGYFVPEMWFSCP